MITESVIPDDGGREGRWVALSIAVILLVAAILLPYHQSVSDKQELAAHQISLANLEAQELAMIGDLRLAHEEIRNLHQDSIEFDDKDIWPSITELEALWLAPFVKDKSWQHKGEHLWHQVAPGIYQGLRQSELGAVSVILSCHAQEPDVWIDFNLQATPFEGDAYQQGMSLSDSVLIKAGWQQVAFIDHQDTHNH